MKGILNIFLTFIFLISTISVAQDDGMKKANKEYDEFAFADAQKTYLAEITSGFSSQEVLKKLGDSYYNVAEYAKAVKWYEALYNEHHSTIAPDYLYRYAQSLKSVKNYDIADKIMAEFNKSTRSDNRVQLFEKENKYLKEIGDTERFDFEKAKFNTELSEFAPAFYLDKLVFATNGQDITRGTRIHNWNYQPFFDLYIIDLNPENGPMKLKRLGGNINTKFHESTAVFSKDGSTVYFTRNNFTNGNYKKDAKGTNLLKLYRGRLNSNGKWKIEELPFNNDEYSVAHPALSTDENTLYFASDMPGGIGSSDLYKVDITANGFGTPVNLGEAINTRERETFPFVSAENKLYFASDGHVGFGGLDIFVTDMKQENSFGQAYNLGKPINGPQDDFTFIIDTETEFGYFASNRKDGVGHDDIYRFKRLTPLIIK